MRGSRSALRIALGGATAGMFVLVQSASGQDGAPAGLRAVVDYSLGLDVDTNEQLSDPSPGTYSALVNSFDIAILSNTRNESFALSFAGQLRLESDPGSESSGDELAWQQPSYSLQYSREAANARLSLSANLRQRDVDTIEPFFIDVDGDTIVDEVGFDETEGTLTETGATVTLETGLNAPLGTTYTASFQSRTYDETTDPDLYDRVNYRLATSTRLRFSGVATGRVDLAAQRYEYSQGRDLTGESYTATLGYARELSPTLSIDMSLGYSKNREEETIDGLEIIDETQGPDAAFRFTKEVPNGSYFGSYRRELVEDTFRNRLTFGREISMATYDLSASIGVTNLDGEDPAPTFGLFYARQLPTGRFNASLRRTVTVTTEDEERALTSAVVGYSHAISEASSVNVGFDYTFVTSPTEEDTGEDETRATLTASYTHALTRDWNMTVGYRGRSESTETEDAFSNAVFVNIGRQFIVRP